MWYSQPPAFDLGVYSVPNRIPSKRLTCLRPLANIIEAVEKIVTVDWSECELVESVPEKVGGRPVVKGTRIPADTSLTDQELGATVEETHESFPSLSVETIRSLR